MEFAYRIEFRIGGAWSVAAQVKDDDLAEAALKAFRKASPGVLWRIARG